MPNLGVAVVLFLLFWLVGKGIRALVTRLSTKRRRRLHAALVFGRLAGGITVILGIFLALWIAVPAFTFTDLLELLGLGSVAVGFAFRDVLQNFLAGILLLATEPFRIGDQIIYEKYEGTVEDIQTRATFMRTYDGRRIVIPNANLFTNPVTVNTAFDDRRWEYDVGIGVGDDIERAKKVMLEAVREVKDVLRDPPPEALVVELADFSVKVRLWWWTAPPSRLNVLQVQDAVLSVVKKRLIENGIDLPFPTQQVLFHDQTEETDGDRRRQREGWPAGRRAADVPRAMRVVDALKRLDGRSVREQDAQPGEVTGPQGDARGSGRRDEAERRSPS
jgi:small-conductance mechanosensitive channel